MIDQLYQLILDRKENPTEGSYTSTLLAGGVPNISQKVGEEATEVVVAALSQENRRLIEELADLAYHTLVLMAAKGVTPGDVKAALQRRRK